LEVRNVFSLFSRGSDAKPKTPAELPYVLGMKWVVRSRVEQNELSAVEDAIREMGGSDIVLDKIEPGPSELAFWLHTSDPKRAFKKLTALPQIAERMSTLQAAYASRTSMKFSVLWPKGRHASTPQSLR
jgi:hypothetical protein